MNATETSQSNLRVREYLDLWIQLISEYLGSLVHTNVQAEIVRTEELERYARERNETGLWIRVAADPRVEQAFYLSNQDVTRISQMLGGRAAGVDSMRDLDSRKAAAEVFRRVAAKIAVADWMGFPTELSVSESREPDWQSVFETAISFSTPQGPLAALHSLISPGLATALESVPQKDLATKRNYPAMDPNPLRSTSEALKDNRLELLMDVELEVVLRFGQREMLLRDVLTLTPGTVLELDQQVQDPVELLVGNRVIAWGEVVAVDGNYGLRITSLASRKERLESLRK